MRTQRLLRSVIQRLIEEAGSAEAVAVRFSVSLAFVHDILAGRRELPEAWLEVGDDRQQEKLWLGPVSRHVLCDQVAAIRLRAG